MRTRAVVIGAAVLFAALIGMLALGASLAPTVTQPSPTPTPTTALDPTLPITPTPLPPPTGAAHRTLAPTAPPTGMVLTGEVTDAATGEPIPDVCLYMGIPNNIGLCIGTTDVNGNYYVDVGSYLVPSGSQLYLVARKPGYPDFRTVSIRLRSPTVLDIAMPR